MVEEGRTGVADEIGVGGRGKETLGRSRRRMGRCGWARERRLYSV
jgi:hypothetical protein